MLAARVVDSGKTPHFWVARVWHRRLNWSPSVVVINFGLRIHTLANVKVQQRINPRCCNSFVDSAGSIPSIGQAAGPLRTDQQALMWAFAYLLRPTEALNVQIRSAKLACHASL